MNTLRQSKRICCFSSILLFLFAVFSPCTCLADISGSLDQATKTESNNHSGCGQEDNSQSDSDKNCAGCSHCSRILNYHYDSVPKLKLVHSNNLEFFPDPTLFTAFQPRPELQNQLGPHYIGPPGFRIRYSSTLSKLFHRWLV